MQFPKIKTSLIITKKIRNDIVSICLTSNSFLFFFKMSRQNWRAQLRSDARKITKNKIK